MVVVSEGRPCLEEQVSSRSHSFTPRSWGHDEEHSRVAEVPGHQSHTLTSLPKKRGRHISNFVIDADGPGYHVMKCRDLQHHYFSLMVCEQTRYSEDRSCENPCQLQSGGSRKWMVADVTNEMQGSHTILLGESYGDHSRRRILRSIYSTCCSFGRTRTQLSAVPVAIGRESNEWTAS